MRPGAWRVNAQQVVNRDLCIAALKTLRQAIPPSDHSTCLDYIEHGEWGLCLESLSGCLLEEQIQISPEQFDSICSAAAAMGLTVDLSLRNLVG